MSLTYQCYAWECYIYSIIRSLTAIYDTSKLFLWSYTKKSAKKKSYLILFCACKAVLLVDWLGLTSDKATQCVIADGLTSKVVWRHVIIILIFHGGDGSLALAPQRIETWRKLHPRQALHAPCAISVRGGVSLVETRTRPF